MHLFLITLSVAFATVFGALPTRPDPVCGLPILDAWPVSQILPNIFAFTRTKNSTSYRIADLSQIATTIADLEKNDFFKIGRQVVFIAHGFWNNELFSWQYKIKDAILKADDSTVIVVTWGLGSILPSYRQAGANTQTVAEVISGLAEAAMKSQTFKNDPNQIYLYCIGHSLGAQICGQAGRMNRNFDRVTGLDPAGPGFERCWSKYHVDKRSATCVDHIHTDGSGKDHFTPILPAYFGTLAAWGHVDFYPAGGAAQPGCAEWNKDPSCSHMKAIDYFQYSIENRLKCQTVQKCASNAYLPESCAEPGPIQQMGYYSSCYKDNSPVRPGIYYLTTQAASPFC